MKHSSKLQTAKRRVLLLTLLVLFLQMLVVLVLWMHDDVAPHVKEQTLTIGSLILDEKPEQSGGEKPRKIGKFAYAFIISGCTETSCFGYILNVMVASQVLRHANSTADIVLKVRMNSYSNATKLDSLHETWLRQVGVKVQYINKIPRDNFGLATLEKFRIFEMTEYDRILFLDADITPKCNLDYLFEQSYNQDGLSGTVGLQGGVSPVSASVILVTPRKGQFGQIIDIVRRHRQRNLSRFDANLGWGHRIDPKDKWKSWKRRGHHWSFYAVTIDQGLLFHWLKYENMNFSHILHNNVVESWAEVTHNVSYWRNVTNVFEVAGNRSIAMIHRKVEALKGCGGVHKRAGKNVAKFVSHPPYSDFFHFAGNSKPWNRPIAASELPQNTFSLVHFYDIWLYWVGVVNKTLDPGLPTEIRMEKGNPNGLKPKKGGRDLLSPNIQLPSPAESL